MELTSLPTDSLYKLMALLGLVLMTFSLTYPPSKILELELAVADAELQSKKLQLSSDNIERELTRLEQLEKPTREDVASTREKSIQVKLESFQFENTVSKIQIQYRWLKFYSILSVVGATVGLFLMSQGLWLWYTRIQRPSDRFAAGGR